MKTKKKNGAAMKKTKVPIPDLASVLATRRAAAKNRDKKIRAANARNSNSYLVELARKEERIANDKRLKEKERRKKMDIANTRIEPTEGRAPTGEIVRVNRNSGPGHFLALHRQKPDVWTKPMVDAAARFGKDYELTEFGGIGASSYEPRVDNSVASGEGKSAVSVIARQRLDELRRRVGSDDFVMLECTAGMGMTQTEMHAMGMGDKRVLGERLRLALNRAAAFYGGLREDPQSEFYRAARLVIDTLKRRA